AAGVFEAVARMEALVTRATDLTGVALRFGALYGPGTSFAVDGDLVTGVARRRVPIVGRGDGVFSFCHVEDAAAATVCALTRGAGVYNIIDDEPAPVRTWLPYLAAQIGARPPFRVPTWLAWLGAGGYGVYLMARQRAVSNQRARDELGFVPTIASWRTGFRDLAPARLAGSG
ncbi:MAG TPA: NAD(P)-dependent oxidoreductase, partial [Kofleriaceae bacterium]|nr:NAD(P)-dependent oxidoreductase [Kofleriaceae bacterium]